MKNLILVRHGESAWNKLNLFTGWTDVDLTEAGMAEAFEAGRLLKVEGFRPELCFTSYLKRAVKTLNQILDAMDMDWLPVKKSWRLNEKSYGAIQGLNKADTAAKYGDEQVLLWRRSFDVQPPALDLHDERSPRMDPRYNEIPDAQIPLTESLKDTIERIMPYYRECIMPAFNHHDTLLVVAHGNSLRAIVKELKGMTNEEIIKFNLPTAVPYVFTFDDRMQLTSDRFLGDPEAIAAKMQSVANQAKRK
ncbi:MAG: 2,3-diphosphoglycerate-dependent phosphoglycerate mutase [Bacteroidales bacterium]|nr:2,3-diphosphoglycerate-dependent phosphoglycerate mutase [Bacteroidales bacterium]